MTDDRSVDAALARALDAYASLTGLGEEVEDEWTYVTDLSSAWQDRLDEVATARAGEPLDATVHVAIDRAIDEISRIEDAHRAIDWLSTFPQVVLIALGEQA
jgi:hypothetical protein